MKKGLVLLAVLAAALALTGCSLVGYDEALDNAQIVAKVNDTEITKAEWIAYRDYLASYYEQYYQQNLGISLPMTEETLESYGESALEEMIETAVVHDKLADYGFDPLGEEDAAEVEAYADSMVDLYKQLIRYQNYPDIETVEEERERLTQEAEEAAAQDEPETEEATPDEPTESAEAEGDTAETEGDAAEAEGDTAEAEGDTAEAEGDTAEAEAESPEAEVDAAEAESDAAEAEEPIEIDESLLTATVTDAELDEMLTADLEAMGYTRDYFVQQQTAQVQNDLIYAEVTKDVAVTDDEARAKFDEEVASQKESYDATPTLYASAESGGHAYYVPEGYRGVKNLLIALNDEDQTAIDELNSTLSTATAARDSAQSQLDELNAEDTSDYDEEALAARDEQIAALTEQVSENDATVAETQAALDAKTEEAFAAILPEAEEVLAKAQAGEDFDELLETYGDDDGMKVSPASERGYLICEGLTTYVTEFQEAAMALGAVGDISDLVRTSYGYHILQYAQDIPAGPVEYTDEIAEHIKSDLLTEAQDAAYEAAVNQWVSEADVKTFPKTMK